MKSAPKGYKNGFIEITRNGNNVTGTVRIGYRVFNIQEVRIENEKIILNVNISGIPLKISMIWNENGNLTGASTYDEWVIPIVANKVDILD